MKESQTTEWKECWRDEYLRWLCGFANAEGGVLVIGRNDQGAPVGVKDAKKLLEDLPNKIRDVLGIIAEVRLIHDSGLDLIEIHIEPYPYPISYKGEYHVRTGSTKQELKRAALDKFLLKKQGRTWDGVPLPDATIRSLSKSAVDSFRAGAMKSERMNLADLKESMSGLMDKLHLLDGKNLKRAAVLAFHPDPEKFVTGAFVKIGYFRTNDDLLYHDEVHGDLFSQVSQTLDLLRTKYLKAAIRYQGIQRIEAYPVPEPALRESLLNAIIHKDYSTGSPVQISVYADKMMIWNPGQLPAEWTVDRLTRKHPSLPFNPDLANVFFRAGEIEAWGRGFERMFAACREAGFPEPQIEVEATGLWLTFNYSPHIIDRTNISDETGEKTRDITREKTRDKILRLLRQNPTVSTDDLAAAIGITRKGVEWQIQKLKSEGIVKRVGPDKGGHWEVLE